MIPWYWVLVALVVGELIGFCALLICVGRDPQRKTSKYVK